MEVTFAASAEAFAEHAHLFRSGGQSRGIDGERTAAPPMTAPWVDTGTPIVFVPGAGTGCSHLDGIRPVTPWTKGCTECLAAGERWVHLRVCLECGNVGCCDSSPGKHATAHFHETGHPVMRSLEPGETWGWCFVDSVSL